MRAVVALRLVVASLVGLLACATAHVAVGPWQAPLDREHSLVGRVWSVRAARFVTPDAMVRELAPARFVLLGEKHDNPDHHQMQAAVLRGILATGRRPLVAFEMFTPDDTPAITRHLAAAPRDAAGLGAAVDWKHSGWPDWQYYQPIAQAALDAGVPIVAANLTPAAARALARGQRSALPAGLAERYALDQPPPAALQAALTTEIRDAHCGHFPADRVDGMVLAQRARDSALAESLLAGSDGAVLIAGTGHVRNDRGVPSYLRLRVPAATIATLAPLEVQERWTQPSDYAAAYGGALPFDWVWFTPRMDDEDPCARFRQPPAPPRG
jgi:uncharacterized iron-regulated protein